MSKSGGPETLESHVVSDPGPTAADPAVARAFARVGTTLHEKWHLDSLLGIGGTAVVYAATHRNGSRAAVKILNPELSLHPQVRERFFREGYAANLVGHEGTVKVFDDDVAHDGSLFLVTELLDGESLEDRRVRLGGRLGEAEVLWLSDQLLDVIRAAHEKGIVHRDLKPENVFLTRGGQLKVLDFGIAALRELSTTHVGTITGAVMGTPAYMPPEQALGLWDDVDAQSDVWAWGATMFHLLSGQVVHDGRTPNEQLSRAITGSAVSLSSVAPDVAPAIARIVDLALEREKTKRWPDARSMQEAIRSAYVDRFAVPIAVLGDVTSSGSSDPPSPGEERRSTPTFRATALPAEGTPSLHLPGLTARRRRTAIAVAGALALAVLGTCVNSLVTVRGPSPAAEAPSATQFILVAPPASLVVASPDPLLDGGATVGDPALGDAAPGKKSPVSPPRSTASAKQPTPRSCTPPYVIEPDTGKRRWKLECL